MSGEYPVVNYKNMNKIFSIFFGVFLSVGAYGQHYLSETDTSINYKDIFYKGGQLDLDGYYVYVIDTVDYYSGASTTYYDFQKFNYGPEIDSNKMFKVWHGKWKIDYEVKKGFIIKRKREYYYLGRYEGGYLQSKKYDFNDKGRLISTLKRYPKIKSVIYQGTQLILYDKFGNISSIHYNRFIQDEDLTFYWYDLYYDKKGNLTYYTFIDDKLDTNEHCKYNEHGELIEFYKRTPKEWIDKKWSRNRNRLKVIEYKVGSKTIKKYHNGELVKEKTK